ncbi:MAG TPA: TraR/DksA C4-type zinc finger protein [Candidatus Eisenbacteria bacterium]|nr:TraR/DksA C4-type zinc finger protein [Candidatus Eisenbacteria bacterium]
MRCGQEIGAERLRLLPTAILCINCASARESKARKARGKESRSTSLCVIGTAKIRARNDLGRFRRFGLGESINGKNRARAHRRPPNRKAPPRPLRGDIKRKNPAPGGSGAFHRSG